VSCPNDLVQLSDALRQYKHRLASSTAPQHRPASSAAPLNSVPTPFQQAAASFPPANSKNPDQHYLAVLQRLVEILLQEMMGVIHYQDLFKRITDEHGK
jgi:hypothetical protein